MQLPQPGDLISIEKKIHGVIVNDRQGSSPNWGYTLCKIDPDHTALILETYVPNALSSTKPARKPDEMLQADQEKVVRIFSTKKPPYKEVPEGVLMLVLSIGDNIAEVVWDPRAMSIVSM